MARQNGRTLRIKRGSTVVSVVKTKTITVNNTPVDVTGDDDDGFITLLEQPGTKQIVFECSGVTDDDTLRDAAVTGTALLTAHTIEYMNAAGTDVVYAILGSFFLNPFSETGAHDGALEFSATLSSSGAWSKSTA
jgi:predicted secreted protein